MLLFTLPVFAYWSGSYIVGSLPIGYALVQLLYGKDIRKYGSGNSGATNAARVTGVKSIFFIVFLSDAFKAWAWLTLISLFLPDVSTGELLFLQSSSALFLLVGNGYSVFLGFEGGKGVATSIGILAAMASPVFLGSAILLQGLFFGCIKIMGIASVLTTVSLPAVHLIFFFSESSGSGLFILYLLMALWIIFRHKKNIQQFFKAP